MEFLKPLQRRSVLGAGRNAFRIGDVQTRSRFLRIWQLQQAASIHQQSRTQRAFRSFWRIKWFQRRSVRWQSSKPSPNPTEHLGSPEPTSLSARMKKLSREYGWSALGVYLSLSALDFPFCFLAVRWLGTDRIAHWEHVVVETFWKGMESVYPEARAKLWPQSDEKQVVEEGAREGGGWGVEEADARNKSESASLWTQLALAYAIHKSFIFIRVPLTVAVTPKVVKTLRSWGWNIGKRKPK